MDGTHSTYSDEVHQPDVLVVGGGIAGVSVGHELARAGHRVVLVEAEATLAYHTTGRSAAQYLETYGNQTLRRLTLGSRSFFADPPLDLVDGALWAPRPLLRVGRAEHVDTLRAEADTARALVPSVDFLDGDEARTLFPPLRPDIEAALHEPDAMELDVAAIHQAYVRGMRGAGAEIMPSCRVTALKPSGSGWRVTVATANGSSEDIDAGVVVNAAGAWGDQLGEMAGAAPLGLRPLRRTFAVAALPEGFDPEEAKAWPIVSFSGPGGGMEGYCKPEAGGLLVSPADETPSEPCDAKPEEIDVAYALDRLAAWTTINVRNVRATWAGLRSFTADRTPVAGFAPDAPGFFWLTGQGGYGIQSGPALARVAAALIGGADLPDDLAARGLAVSDLAADRPGLIGPLTPGH